MTNLFERTELLLGKDTVSLLEKKRVAVFGIGGVGGYCAEALVRSGIGHFDLIDNDTVSITNINRQIIASTSTIGKYKTAIMAERMQDINPNVDVTIHNCFFLPENKEEFDFTKFDYIVDAVDTVTAKLTIIEEADKAKVPVISCMGAGNKLDPTQFEVADIADTSVCPLAKVMRRELKKRGILHVKVVYSMEQARKPQESITDGKKREIPGSVAFVPSVAGLIMAGEVIKDLCRIQ